MNGIDHIGQLTPDNKNARRHNPRNVGLIVDALHEVGAARSIVIDENGRILAGNATVEAAAVAGIERVQVVDVDGETIVAVRRRGLTEAQKVRLALYDNRSAELADWDPEILADLQSADGLLGNLFTDFELEDLLGELSSGPEPDPGAQVDRAAELQEKWQVRTGGLWEIGAHRLICGDCTDAAVVSRVMGGEKAGAVVTDPPYGINREGIVNDDPEGLQALFDGALAVMPIQDAVVIAFQSPRLFPIWLDAVRAAGHKFERMLWMHRKAGKSFPWRGWVLVGDPIQVSSFGDPEWGEPSNHEFDCYVKSELESHTLDGLHTAIKPVSVVQDLVDHTVGIVYDPFLGSGTTMVACEQLHRRCFGIEIEPKYCSVVLERMSGGMGLEPRRVE